MTKGRSCILRYLCHMYTPKLLGTTQNTRRLLMCPQRTRRKDPSITDQHSPVFPSQPCQHSPAPPTPTFTSDHTPQYQTTPYRPRQTHITQRLRNSRKRNRLPIGRFDLFIRRNPDLLVPLRIDMNVRLREQLSHACSEVSGAVHPTASCRRRARSLRKVRLGRNAYQPDNLGKCDVDVPGTAALAVEGCKVVACGSRCVDGSEVVVVTDHRYTARVVAQVKVGQRVVEVEIEGCEDGFAGEARPEMCRRGERGWIWRR